MEIPNIALKPTMFVTKKNPTSESSSTRQRRHGVAAVEAAFCLPVIVILMFGTLEICAGYSLQESLTIAAYEGARFGARNRQLDDSAGPTLDDVNQYVIDFMEQRGVNITAADVVVETEGRDGVRTVLTTLNGREVLAPIVVTVSCATDGNSTFVFSNFANRRLSATVAFASEFGTDPSDLNE